MRRLTIAGLLACAAGLGALAAPAGAADECAGLMDCIPVTGPWVAIPTGDMRAARWEMTCPDGGIGGTDARVSDIRVDVSFPGRVGSPVGPGITVPGNTLVFTGRYVGTVTGRPAAFQPFLGCVPGGGGGRRTPTAWRGIGAPVATIAAAAVRPSLPLVVRTKTLRVTPGSLARGTLRCAGHERLVHATTAVGLHTAGVPTAAQLHAIKVVRVVEAGRILVSATRHGLDGTIGADVQIQADCAR